MKKEAEVKEKKGTENYFVSKGNIKLLKACIDTDNPALLIGETGVGKTTIIREVAKEQKKNLVRISVNGSMGVEEILGKWLVDKGTTKWQDGILTAALRSGDWVVMDEINAALPEILFTLHSLLDDDRKIILPEKDNEVVVPHTNFRFFATMNPPEEYSGTKDMNKALMSRFHAVIYVDVLSETDEVKLLEIKGADLDTALKLVKVATILRLQKTRDNIFYFCSTRDLVQTAQLKKSGLTLVEAFTGAVVNKMGRDEYKLVEPLISSTIAQPKIALPAKTLEEIIEIATNAEKEIELVKKEYEIKLKEETQKIEDKAKLEARDQVSTDFLDRLKELSSK